MLEPVSTVDGHTYDRKAIEEWLERHDTSPVTGALEPSIASWPCARPTIDEEDADT